MSKKTPWNPSRKAIARVKNPLPVPTECNCCRDFETGEQSKDCIEIVENCEIYGKNYGEWPWVYMCIICKAYVGLHPFTDIPLGTLADGPTRQARKKAKEPFELLHLNGKLSRSEAYRLLAEKMGITVSECHFSWFDVEQCKKAQSMVREIFKEISRR